MDISYPPFVHFIFIFKNLFIMKKRSIVWALAAAVLSLSSCKDDASGIEAVPVFMNSVSVNGPSCGPTEFANWTINGRPFQINYTPAPGICTLVLGGTCSFQTTYHKTHFGQIMPAIIPLGEFFSDYPFDVAQPQGDTVGLQVFMEFSAPSIADLQPGDYKVQNALGWQDRPGVEFWITLDFWRGEKTFYQYTLAPNPAPSFQITSIENLPDNATKICGSLKGRLVPWDDHYTADYTFDIEGDFSYILQ